MSFSFQKVKLTIQKLIVVYQVPKWCNAKYDGDDDVYAYSLQHNYKIGDDRIKESKNED